MGYCSYLIDPGAGICPKFNVDFCIVSQNMYVFPMGTLVSIDSEIQKNHSHEHRGIRSRTGLG